MPDEAPTETSAEGVENENGTAGQSTADGAETAGQEASKETDWQAKFEAQQKVNRDLERKLKGEAGTLNSKIAELQAKLDGTEKEHAETIKQREAEEKALAKANDRIRKAEVRAAAAGKLNDPADALRYLDLDQIEVGDDGEVDASAVTEAIEALVKSKPYLAAEGGTGPVIHSPTSNREGSTTKKQWTEADVKGATPAQIVAAKAEGLLDEYLSS